MSAAESSSLPLVVEHKKTGMLLRLVPGGKFLMGGPGDYEGKCPPFELEIPAYYLAVYPVTNRQYAQFVQETGHRAPNEAEMGDPVWTGESYPESLADHPVICVDWADAAAYCQWAGLRLPREFEWEKAARGVDGRQYPWGADWDESKCRNALNRGSQTTAIVSAYPAGNGPFGHAQMIGNVMEWCEDWDEKAVYDRYKAGDLQSPASGNSRVSRGGSWDYGDAESLSACRRNANTPDFREETYGFRCALSTDVAASQTEPAKASSQAAPVITPPPLPASSPLPLPTTKPAFDPFDPQLERLMKAFSDALIQYTPGHFKEIHCAVREGREGDQTALFYQITCPQYPDEGTTNPSREMNVIGWQLQEHWEAREGSFPGFTMICRMKEDGTWSASLERLPNP